MCAFQLARWAAASLESLAGWRSALTNTPPGPERRADAAIERELRPAACARGAARARRRRRRLPGDRPAENHPSQTTPARPRRARRHLEDRRVGVDADDARAPGAREASGGQRARADAQIDDGPRPRIDGAGRHIEHLRVVRDEGVDAVVVLRKPILRCPATLMARRYRPRGVGGHVQVPGAGCQVLGWVCWSWGRGAGGGNRTHTTLRSRDFESRASASFTTPALASDSRSPVYRSSRPGRETLIRGGSTLNAPPAALRF